MSRHYKYLHDDLTEVDESGYQIEDGVIVDPSEELRPNSREYGALTRRTPPSRNDLLAEEARWAAQSGPVQIIQPPRSTA